jgi:hypothetical protein
MLVFVMTVSVSVAVTVIVVVLVPAVVVSVVVVVHDTIRIAVEVFFPAEVTTPVRVLAAFRARSPIAIVGIKVFVHVTAEAFGTMEPWACTNEDSTGKPLWAIVADGRALVRRIVEVAVWANGGYSDVDGDLRSGLAWRDRETKSSES